LATENIKKVALEKITDLYLWNAIDIVPNLEHDYQMVFVDGMKKRTKDFFLLSYDKLEVWGIMIIDDVILFREKMQDLYIHLEENNITYNVIPIDVNDWVMLIVK
jgi:predicted O-methyltransferase YrrM